MFCVHCYVDGRSVPLDGASEYAAIRKLTRDVHLDWSPVAILPLPGPVAIATTGTVLVRGHDPAKAPDWFGPPHNSSGKHRFDVPFRDADCNVGTCYLAERLDGVLLERVLRGISRAVLTISTLHVKHAITLATTKRALVLIDLVHTLSTVHGLEAEGIVAQPPYGKTQAMARQWAQATHPTPVDGI